jgi:hypothetical protein
VATPKPLRILVTDPRLMERAEIQAWSAKGHVVELRADLTDVDLILGANAWHMTLKHVQYAELAEKAARKRRYNAPAKKGEADA